MDTTIESELKCDFEDALKKINFLQYNPRSQEFSDALRIGVMWFLSGHLCGKCKCNLNSEIEEYSEKEDGSEEEIRDAKKYLQKYLDTREEAYRDMARDEIKHARILLKKAYAKLPGNEEKLKLKKFESETEEVLKLIENA